MRAQKLYLFPISFMALARTTRYQRAQLRRFIWRRSAWKGFLGWDAIAMPCASLVLLACAWKMSPSVGHKKRTCIDIVNFDGKVRRLNLLTCQNQRQMKMQCSPAASADESSGRLPSRQPLVTALTKGSLAALKYSASLPWILHFA